MAGYGQVWHGQARLGRARQGVEGFTMRSLVLLSGGMDSTVCLYWAKDQFGLQVDAITFDYGQVARREISAAERIYRESGCESEHFIVQIPPTVFAGQPSILGRSAINDYATPAQAVTDTASDRAYIPIRNAIFLTIAAHHLLVRMGDDPAGRLIIGVRQRLDAAGGFADCTPTFVADMEVALSSGSGRQIHCYSPLNFHTTGRASTISWARTFPGCFEALTHTISCYRGLTPPCGECLPCVRRAQAFAELELRDPAYG